MQHSARGRERVMRQAIGDLFVPTEAAVTGEGRAHQPTRLNGIRWEIACYQGSQEDQGIIHGAVGFGVRCWREGLQSRVNIGSSPLRFYARADVIRLKSKHHKRPFWHIYSQHKYFPRFPTCPLPCCSNEFGLRLRRPYAHHPRTPSSKYISIVRAALIEPLCGIFRSMSPWSKRDSLPFPWSPQRRLQLTFRWVSADISLFMYNTHF